MHTMLPTTSSRVILPSLLKNIRAAPPQLPALVSPPPQLIFSTSRLFSSAATRRIFPPSPVSTRIKQFSTTTIRCFAPTTAAMGVATITNPTEFNNALETSKLKTASNSPKLVVIDCFATWCGPCKMIAPHMEAFSEKYPEVAFYKVDVDEVPDVAQELGVRAMPTFVYFKDGEKVDEVLGAAPPNIEAAIQKHK